MQASYLDISTMQIEMCSTGHFICGRGQSNPAEKRTPLRKIFIYLSVVVVRNKLMPYAM